MAGVKNIQKKQRPKSDGLYLAIEMPRITHLRSNVKPVQTKRPTATSLHKVNFSSEQLDRLESLVGDMATKVSLVRKHTEEFNRLMIKVDERVYPRKERSPIKLPSKADVGRENPTEPKEVIKHQPKVAKKASEQEESEGLGFLDMLETFLELITTPGIGQVFSQLAGALVK